MTRLSAYTSPHGAVSPGPAPHGETACLICLRESVHGFHNGADSQRPALDQVF